MDDLITWLKDCLSEDKRKAWAAARAANREGVVPGAIWVAPGGLVGSPSDDPRYGVGDPLWDCEGSDTLCMNPDAAAHVALWDPDRVLREVEAKRRILDGPLTGSGPDQYTEWEWTLKVLALPYSDRPGYRSEWAL